MTGVQYPHIAVFRLTFNSCLPLLMIPVDTNNIQRVLIHAETRFIIANKGLYPSPPPPHFSLSPNKCRSWPSMIIVLAPQPPRIYLLNPALAFLLRLHLLHSQPPLVFLDLCLVPRTSRMRLGVRPMLQLWISSQIVLLKRIILL